MALVSLDANVTGDVALGPLTCVQPAAQLQALQGQITMGGRNVVESATLRATKEERPFVIGEGNLFEDHSLLQDCQIGDYCVVGPRARLKDNTLIGGNVVAPGVVLEERRVLDLNEAVFFDADGRLVSRIVPDAMAKRRVAHDAQLAAIAKVMQAGGKLKK